MQEADGHRIHLERDKKRNLQQLISPAQHKINFKYDEADRIILAVDDTGNVRKYSYNSSGHLETVSDASHLLYRFEYEPLLHSPGYDPYLMTAIVDGKGTVLLQNSYRDGSRVSLQKLANGDVYRYDYIFKGNEIVETIADDPAGKRRFFFEHGRFAREE